MHYSANDDARHDTVLGENGQDIIIGLNNTLLAADWIEAETVGSQVVFHINVMPSVNETLTVDGVTYTLKDTFDAPNQVLHGATAAAIVSAIADAINDNEANEGVTYSTGTSAHPTLYADYLGDRDVAIIMKTGGAGTFMFSTTIYSGSFDAAVSRFGGYKMKSGLNNAGHYFYLEFQDVNTYIRIRGYDDSLTGSWCYLYAGTSRYFEFLASEVHLFTCVQGGVDIVNEAFQAALLYIKPFALPVVISAVEDDGTGQVKVTTSAAHGMVTGDQVDIRYALGLDINGYQNVTVVDVNHYILDGSTYAAGYVADSARSANRFQLSRAWFTQGQPANTTYQTWRKQFAPVSYCPRTVAMGRWAYNVSHDQPCIHIHVPGTIYLGEPVWNWGGFSDIIEAACSFRILNDSSGWVYKMGDLYYAFVSRAALQDESVCPDFDGKSWYCYNSVTNHSLWICRGNVV